MRPNGDGLVLDIGDLGDPAAYTDPVELGNLPTNAVLAFLEKMLLIRRTEETVAELIVANEVRCPCHLSVGQEAVAVGVAHHLRTTDRSFGTHRSHSHYLALGGSVEALLAEILGRSTGCSHGRGGSMHIRAPEVGFFGSMPIVGGTIPLAVGAGFAAKLDGGDDISVAFFGDGACEEGIFHESLNLAASMQIPILFVVENNLFSSHLDLHFRQPSNAQARFAAANSVPYRIIDGNDVVTVSDATSELISVCRRQKKPALLEAVTYRWYGHVGPNSDFDVGVRRSRPELVAWKRRDPVRRLEEALAQSRNMKDEALEKIRDRVADRVRVALDAARAAPFPELDSLLDGVLAV